MEDEAETSAFVMLWVFAHTNKALLLDLKRRDISKGEHMTCERCAVRVPRTRAVDPGAVAVRQHPHELAPRDRCNLRRRALKHVTRRMTGL